MEKILTNHKAHHAVPNLNPHMTLCGSDVLVTGMRVRLRQLPTNCPQRLPQEQICDVSHDQFPSKMLAKTCLHVHINVYIYTDVIYIYTEIDAWMDG